MVGLWLRAATARLDRIVASIVSGPRWRFKALFLVLFVCLFRAFPDYRYLRTAGSLKLWNADQFKVDHPLADMARLFPLQTHQAKLTFRLTVPVIAHVLHLGRAGMLILFALCGMLLLFSVLALTYRITRSRSASLYVCLTVGCIWPGLLPFHQIYGGVYEAVSLPLLLLAMIASSPALTAVLVFAAAWTDERALFASLLVYLFAIVQSGRESPASPYTGKPAAILLAWFGYVGTRLYLTLSLRLITATGGIGFAVLGENFHMLPVATWSALAGAWLWVAFGFLALALKRRYAMAGAFGCVVVALLGTGLMTGDITRSLAYCLPAVFLGMGVASESETKENLQALARLCALISFLVPTFYVGAHSTMIWLLPFPMQVLRWLFHSRLG